MVNGDLPQLNDFPQWLTFAVILRFQMLIQRLEVFQESLSRQVIFTGDFKESLLPVLAQAE